MATFFSVIAEVVAAIGILGVGIGFALFGAAVITLAFAATCDLSDFEGRMHSPKVDLSGNFRVRSATSWPAWTE